jgi:NADPH:quinone reductase-like Zn-dependent oxidoreductase
MDAIGPSSFKRSYSVLRQGGRLIMFGLSEVQTGDRRDLPAVLKGLARMPLATMPWWKSLSMMNENKGVFGLNMLSWWDREGLDRAIGPLRDGVERGAYQPVIAQSFPFDRAGDAHRYLAEGKNVGKVVLVP